MITIIAKISLYSNVRKTPFLTGYRPLFTFIKEMKTSGEITLISKNEFSPGSSGNVIIRFINAEYLGKNLAIGTKFTFGEGRDPIGEGIIEEIVN